MGDSRSPCLRLPVKHPAPVSQFIATFPSYTDANQDDRARERSGGSLYLGQCLINDKGEMLWSRRKLKPTHVERTVFGEGYARDLIVSDTELGRVGALCCWEHLSPLSKYALYSQHEAIHIAAWPSFSLYSEQAHALSAKVNMAASQIYSVEGQCFTIAASSVVTQETLDMLEVGEHNASLLKVGGGSSMIFAPDGRTLAPYLPHDAEGLIIADLNMEEIAFAKAINDPVGHYSKPEATRLVLDLGHRRNSRAARAKYGCARRRQPDSGLRYAAGARTVLTPKDDKARANCPGLDSFCVPDPASASFWSEIIVACHPFWSGSNQRSCLILNGEVINGAMVHHGNSRYPARALLDGGRQQGLCATGMRRSLPLQRPFLRSHYAS
uniref:CN hydrolase domain-containing protein n=1 Tax=Steinernema glaseri TaxID=37863 RepID=A0A1I8AVH5_9BILA